jgi:hypothetical protein
VSVAVGGAGCERKVGSLFVETWEAVFGFLEFKLIFSCELELEIDKNS